MRSTLRARDSMSSRVKVGLSAADTARASARVPERFGMRSMTSAFSRCRWLSTSPGISTRPSAIDLAPAPRVGQPGRDRREAAAGDRHVHEGRFIGQAGAAEDQVHRCPSPDAGALERELHCHPGRHGPVSCDRSRDPENAADRFRQSGPARASASPSACGPARAAERASAAAAGGVFHCSSVSHKRGEERFHNSIHPVIPRHPCVPWRSFRHASVPRIPRRLIVAVGGNAIDPAGSRGTPEEQKAIAEATAKTMLPLLELDNQLVIVHGNGPQVGKLLLANAAAQERVAPQSLDILVAQTQGALAYILSQAFENALREAGNPRHVVGLVTQVEVDAKDPAFRNPTKPVGPFFSEAEARALAKRTGSDCPRGCRPRLALRRPVAQAAAHLRHLAGGGADVHRTVVIAGGGGGIPVVRDEAGRRHGVEAVIDKDLTTAVMANVLGIRDMMILTAVPRVAIHFGTPRQQELEQVSASDMRRYLAEGHFPAAAWDRRWRPRCASSTPAAGA
jgi:carbamate kinase